MNFNDFIKEGKVKRAKADSGLIVSLVKTSKGDLKFFDKLKIEEISARKIMSGYYDILRSLLDAVCLKKGFKVYSHEAFSFFLSDIKEEVLSKKFDRLRKIRNGINYYGRDISIEEVKENVLEIKSLIKEINNKFLSKGK